MSEYIGLTIGPIVKTIEKARSTGELWGSSYFFSYIMKEIIREIIEEFKTGNDDEKIIRSRFIVPNVEDSSIFNSGKKAGLFHDRFIFESKEVNDMNRVKDVIVKVIDTLSEKIFKEIKDKNYIKTENKDRNSVLEYLKGFLKIYLVKVRVNDGDSVILKVSQYLDALELRENYSDTEEKDYIYYMFNNETTKNNAKHTFLTEDAFKIENKEEEFKKDKKKLYPSLLRIAARELELPEDSKFNDDQEVYNFINSKDFKRKDIIRKFHQYVALVQVDGDRMGEVIKNIDDDESCSKSKEFSKRLFEYSKDAVDLINKYGGFPIYAGGDDLLFLAPLRNIKSEENVASDIFELLLKLDEKFNIYFKEYESQKPSISIGLDIFNYKYPLYDALSEARMLLLNKAKGFKNSNGKDEKNALAFQVVKASGESFSATLSKTGQTYKVLCDIFKDIPISNKSNGVKDTLNQIHIKLYNSKKIIDLIGNDKDKLNNYFENNYNETIHIQDDIKSYIEKLKDFIHTVYVEYDSEISINIIYSCLKFIRFMCEKSEILEERSGKNE